MMKRLLALLLAFALFCPAAMAEASPSARYEAAAVLMLEGDYAAAAEAFAALTGYGDAPQMAIYCRGLALVEAGDFARAEKAFTHLGDFKDAAVRVIACQGMALQMEGEQLVTAGTLQGYTDGPAMLEAAAECYDRIDYLPEMAARAEACRTLASQATLDVAARSFNYVTGAGYGLCVVQRGQLYGVVNARGELVVPCEWDEISLGENAIAVKKDSCWGALSHQGEVILACEYEQIIPFGKVLAVRQQGQFGVLSLTGEVLVPCEWESCDRYGETSLWLRRMVGKDGNAYRYVLTDAAIALPEGVRFWHELSDDVLLLRGTAGEQLYHLPTGTLIGGGVEIMTFGDGFIVVEDYETSAFTWYDADLNVLTVPEGAYPGLSAGFWAYLTEDGGWYLTDLQGRRVLAGDDAEGTGIDEFDGGFSHITIPTDDGETCLLLDASGEIVLTAEKVEDVHGGRYAEIEVDGSPALVDLVTGVRMALPGSPRYVGENLFYVWLGKNEGDILVDAARGWLGETAYDGVSVSAADGLLMVSRDGLKGFVDMTGAEVVPCLYNRIERQGSFYVAYQNVDGGYAYSIINGQGQVFPCEETPIIYGTFYSWRNAEWMYNASGEAVYETDRADSWSAGGGYIFAVEDGLLTVYDDMGSCIY